MKKQSYFKSWVLPGLLITPQVLLALVFVIFPVLQLIWHAIFIQSPHQFNVYLVSFRHFVHLLSDVNYWYVLAVTLSMCALLVFVSLFVGFILAVLVNRISFGRIFYQLFFLWPIVIAPAVAGMLFYYLFISDRGMVSYFLNHMLSYGWQHSLYANQALFLIFLTMLWQLISCSFVVYYLSLQRLPCSLLEMPELDGVGFFAKTWRVLFPLMKPASVVLVSLNVFYVFFASFGVISVLTKGGPNGATSILLYKLYQTGVQGFGTVEVAAQSVIMIGIFAVLIFLSRRTLVSVFKIR